MGSEWTENKTCGIRKPILDAMDQLRVALDHSIEQGDERTTGLLLLTIHDLADILDLLVAKAPSERVPGWQISQQDGC